MQYENIIMSIVASSNNYKFAFKSFDQWVKGKIFINIQTKKKESYDTLPDKQKRIIRKKYDKFAKEDKLKIQQKRNEKPMTESQVRTLAKKVSREVKNAVKEMKQYDPHTHEDNIIYDAARGYVQMTPSLRSFFENKGIKQEERMAEMFADYIP